MRKYSNVRIETKLLRKCNLDCHIVELHTCGKTINSHAGYGTHILHTAIPNINNCDDIPTDHSDINLLTRLWGNCQGH